MKKLVLVILTRFGSLIHCKWLTLWTGALLLSFMQSCRTKAQENSPDITPNDTTKAGMQMCYEPAVLKEPIIEVSDSNVIK